MPGIFADIGGTTGGTVAQPIKLNKLNSKTEKMFSESQVSILLEHIDTNVELIAEGYHSLREEMHQGFSKVWDKFDSLEQDMHSSFKAVLEHLISIDNELAEIKAELKKLNENKADKQELVILEQRLSKLELELNQCKKEIAAKKS